MSAMCVLPVQLCAPIIAITMGDACPCMSLLLHSKVLILEYFHTQQYGMQRNFLVVSVMQGMKAMIVPSVSSHIVMYKVYIIDVSRSFLSVEIDPA